MNEITNLNPIIPESLGEALHAVRKPVRCRLDMLSPLHFGAKGAIDNEDDMHGALGEHAKAVEKCSQLRILTCLCMPNAERLLELPHPYARERVGS